MSVRVAALVATPLGALASLVSPGSGCQASRCCGMLRDVRPVFADEQVGQRRGYSMWSNASEYSATCGFLNLVPGLEEKGGLCNSSAVDSNATVFDAIASSPEAASRLSSGRAVVSTFLEQGTCADIEDGECWSAPAGYADYTWTNELAGPSYSNVRWCWRGSPEHGQPAWGLGCAAEGGLRVLAWLAGTNASGNAIEGGDWFAENCGLAAGLDVSIGADDWKRGSAGAPRWRCFDVPREQPGLGAVRLLVHSVGDLPCSADSTTSQAPPASTTGPVTDAGVGMSSGPAVLVAAIAAAAAQQLA